MDGDIRGNLLVACLPSLQAYLRRVTGDRHTASEVVQEVCLRVLDGEGTEDPERFTAWCFGVARHVLAHDWRRRHRARAELPLEGDVLDEIHAPAFDHEAYVDARAWMARATVSVDPAGLELLVRRYVFEETGPELAGKLAQSSAALRMRLMRLRSTLPSHGDSPAVTPRPAPPSPGDGRPRPAPAGARAPRAGPPGRPLAARVRS
jgi:RNA polymerase sigma factor (sigma-70 family)